MYNRAVDHFDEGWDLEVEEFEKERISVEEMEADLEAPTTELVRRTLFKGGILSALGYRDYRLLWSGALVSNIGTWVHITALLWFVFELTDSNTWVGAVVMGSYLPVFLFVLYAGSLADRLNRKLIIMVTQAVMMLGAFALAVCTTMGWATLPVIMVIVVVMGIAFAFTFPAWQAIVPDLVPPRDLLNGIALNSAQFNLARFTGPALGGLIIGIWSVAAAFYVNGVTFLAVIFAVLMVRTKTPAYPPPPEGTRKHILEGIKFIWSHPWARNILVTIGVISFFGLPYIVLFPALAQDVLGRSEWTYMGLMALSGLGAVIGALLVTYISRYIKEKEIIKFAILGLGLSILILSISRTYWLSLLMALCVGSFFLMASAAINTVLQARVERDMRGGIMSFYILMMIGMFPVGSQVMGILADVRSVTFALAMGGAACALLAVVLLSFPGIIREAVSSSTASGP